MAKISITKPTGNIESFNLLSAFNAENKIYVVLDSEKMGSMGLPIIYVSKYTTKLEKINDANEWQNVKNYLKGIISGTNFEYVKINDQITADEAYYTPLTLPQASFEAIKNHYVIEEELTPNSSAPTLTLTSSEVTPVMPNTNIASNTNVNVSPVMPTPTIEPQNETVMNLIDDAYKANNIPSQINTIPPVSNTTQAPPAEPVVNEASSPIPNIEQKVQPTVSAPSPEPTTVSNINFDSDKETFLKACENMFDALISKYQKELYALEQRKQELSQKEAEINAKLKDASEHLANAEAREQVANIAHDNAQRIMDISNFMPTNPNTNTTT